MNNSAFSTAEADSELEIVKWAAGARRDMPEFQQVDEVRLYNLLQYHSMVPRFLFRFLEERPDWLSWLHRGKPSWASRGLIDGILRAQAAIKNRMDSQVQVLTEIQEKWAKDSGAIIAFKGFTNYALTGDSRFFRAGGDLDLLAPDCNVLTQVLVESGFKGKIWDDDFADVDDRFVAHEQAVLSRNDVKVEVHRYLGISSYPPGVFDEDLNPDRHPGVWTLPPPELAANHGRIRYSDFIAHCTPARLASMEQFTVPNVVMAVFILCTHCFGHAIGANFWRVRMVEIADIVDLINSPEFDRDAFWELVEVYHGHHAIRAVCCLIHAYYGEDIAEHLGPSLLLQPLERLPMQLTYYGGWASPYKLDELLVPLEERAIIERLGTADVQASIEPEPALLYSLSKSNESEDAKLKMVDRVLVESTADCHFGLTYSLTWDKKGILWEGKVSEPFRESGSLLFQLHHDPVDASVFCELSFDIDGEILTTIGSANSVMMSEHGEPIARMCLPWKTNSQVESTRLPILFCAVTRNKAMTPVTIAIAPMNVLRVAPRDVLKEIPKS